MNTVAVSRQPVAISSVLSKVGMAVSGLVMAGWLTLHMAGNLLVFAGPTLYNGYGEALRGTGLLWPARVIVLGAMLLHVMFAVSTTLRAQRARPLRYHSVQRSASTVASRSMRVTGVLLLAFIFYHVFTIYGVGHPAFVSGNGHHNLLAVLHNPWHASAYAIATSLVALHLAHGVASTLITLGLESRKHERLVRRVMWSWCAVVIVGFSLPVVVLGLGII